MILSAIMWSMYSCSMILGYSAHYMRSTNFLHLVFLVIRHLFVNTHQLPRKKKPPDPQNGKSFNRKKARTIIRRDLMNMFDFGFNRKYYAFMANRHWIDSKKFDQKQASIVRALFSKSNKMFNFLANKVVIDSGASVSCTFDKSDFLGEIKPPTYKTVDGIAKGLEVKGEGVIKWTVLDDEGCPQEILVRGIYVPDLEKGNIKLLSPQSHFIEGINGSGNDGDFVINRRHCKWIWGNNATLTIPWERKVRLPLIEVYREEDLDDAIAMLATGNIHDDSNVNITEKQKTILKWHYRLGHFSVSQIAWLIDNQVLGHTNGNSYSKSSQNLKCNACCLGKAKKRPVSKVFEKNVNYKSPEVKHILDANDLTAGDCVSVD